MCNRESKVIDGYTVFEYGGCVWGVGKLEWYDDIKGRRHCLNLCYRCAGKLAKIVLAGDN